MPLAATKVEAKLSPSGELTPTTDKPAFSAPLPSASLSVTHLAELMTK